MPGTLGVIGGSLVGSGGGGVASIPTWIEGPTGANCTVGGTAHTKGAWATLVASTTADADLVMVSVQFASSGTDSACLLDIGIGASGFETVIVPDIACGSASSTSSAAWVIPIPVQIPSGSRIAIRAQSVRTSSGPTAQITLYSGGSVQATGAVALGVDTATSSGVEVGTGWTEVVAATAADYQALVACPSASTTLLNTTTADLIVGTGAPGSEVELGRLPVSTGALETVNSPSNMFGWQIAALLPGVPAGTRIVAKRTTAIDASFIGIS